MAKHHPGRVPDGSDARQRVGLDAAERRREQAMNRRDIAETSAEVAGTPDPTGTTLEEALGPEAGAVRDAARAPEGRGAGGGEGGR